MHRPTEASKIGLLVMKTFCCFHHSNLTHSARLNEMRLLLLVCPYQLFAVSAFRSVDKHIFTSIPQKMFLIDIGNQNQTHQYASVVRLRQIKRTPTLSICLSAAVYIRMFCVHRRIHNHRNYPNGFTPVVVHIYQVCTIHRPRNF